MKPEKQSYCYQHFLEPHTIQLLRLHPGQYDDPLIGDLEFASLGDAPNYEAISYVWGEQTRSAEIACNGCTLTLTRSVDEALRRVRLESHQRLIWADQICINQADLKERSQQIMFMDEIYKEC